jgi:hypothetical protein
VWFLSQIWIKLNACYCIEYNLIFHLLGSLSAAKDGHDLYNRIRHGL